MAKPRKNLRTVDRRRLRTLDTVSNDRRVEHFFTITPTEDLRYQIKTGVRSTLKAFLGKGWSITHIRPRIVNALGTLKEFEFEDEFLPRKRQKLNPPGPSFFSLTDDGLVKFSLNKHTDAVEKEVYPVEEATTKEAKSAEDAKEAFKVALEKALLPLCNTEVEAPLYAGIVNLFEAAEDFAGKAKDTFPAHQEFFGKLADMYCYMSDEEMVENNGCYSKWMDESWMDGR
jgi:hypothetical protein